MRMNLIQEFIDLQIDINNQIDMTGEAQYDCVVMLEQIGDQLTIDEAIEVTRLYDKYVAEKAAIENGDLDDY